jgi:hypothetical protein
MDVSLVAQPPAAAAAAALNDNLDLPLRFVHIGSAKIYASLVAPLAAAAAARATLLHSAPGQAAAATSSG